MRSPIPLALLLLALSLTSSAQACEYPAAPKIPDGKTATKEEMVAAAAAIKTYQTDLNAYRSCLETDYAALPAEQQTPESKAVMDKRYDDSVDTETTEAAAFNEQVRAFNATNK